MAGSDKSLVLLGHIGPAHGLKGEVRIETYTGEPQNIASYGPLTSEDGSRSFEIVALRPVKGSAVIARLKGVSDRTAAEGLRGEKLYVLRERLPAPGEDEFYHADLIGLAAIDADGARIGEIVAVQNFGGGDLLEIRLDATRKTEYAPFTEAFAPVIDIAGGTVTVILPKLEETPDGEN